MLDFVWVGVGAAMAIFGTANAELTAIASAADQGTPHALILRVSGVSYGQPGDAYGPRSGLSLEAGFMRDLGGGFYFAGAGRLTNAPYFGDDFGMLAEFEGELVDVLRPSLSAVPGVQAGAGLRGSIGRASLSFGPELGVLAMSDQGLRLAPFAALLVDAGVDRVGVHVRAGALGMPITWGRHTADGLEPVRTVTEWWRLLEFGASLRF